MGCVLGQHDETGKKEHAIYYLSKKFTDCEQRYSTLEKTCCALAWTTNRLRQYMLSHTTWLISKMERLAWDVTVFFAWLSHFGENINRSNAFLACIWSGSSITIWGWNTFSQRLRTLILTRMDGEELPLPVNSDTVKKFYA